MKGAGLKNLKEAAAELAYKGAPFSLSSSLTALHICLTRGVIS